MALIESFGGVFIYANDAPKLRDWYKENLQLEYQSFEEYGVHFTEFWYFNLEQKKRYALFSVGQAPKELPLVKKYTINFRVQNMDETLKYLKSKGVEIIGPEVHDEGIFAWVIDPEENQVELWEDTKS